MSKDAFVLEEIFPASAEQLYNAWLSSDEHSAFIDDTAEIEPKEGSAFTAWSEYISGTIQKLEPNKLIRMAWRTTEFAEDEEDSIVQLRFEPLHAGCKLILDHSNIPKGQGESYYRGWQDHYFEPMHRYFG